MANIFLFIIPLTPQKYITEERLALRSLCLNTLINQTYSNWKALLIGEKSDSDPKSENFLFINFEGPKEEKLQKATAYILESNLPCDYIIRLDDDDVFNPTILSLLAEKTFDLCVDKYHSFWNSASLQVAQKIMYWFPNTCIHKREHALTVFGIFPSGEYTKFKSEPYLIENEHNDFNKYYSQNNTIIYAEKNNPIYLRSLSINSITSAQADSFTDYLNQHGYWKKNTLGAFSFLNKNIVVTKQLMKFKKQNLFVYFNQLISNKRALKNYHAVIINKKK